MSIILGDVIAPSYDAPDTLWDAFNYYSTAHKEKMAIVTENSMVTYEELTKWIESITDWMKDSGGGQYCCNVPQCEFSNKNIKTVTAEIHLENDEKITTDPYFDQIQKSETCNNDKGSLHLDTQISNFPTQSKIVVGICLNNQPVLIPLIFSIWKKRKPFVVIDPKLPQLRTIQIICSCRPQIIVCDSSTYNKLSAIIDHNLYSKVTDLDKITVLNIDHCTFDCRTKSKSDVTKEIDEPPDKKASVSSTAESDSYIGVYSNDVACILYSTGTTSNPKCVQLTHKNILNRLSWQHSALPFERNEVCLMRRPFAAVNAVTEILVPILGGVPIVVSKNDISVPEVCVKTICQFGVTRLYLLPKQLDELLNYVGKSRSASVLEKAIKLWSVTGEQINSNILMKFYDIFPDSKLINMYGCTETTGDITCYGITERCLLVNGKVPVGSPIYNNGVMVSKQENGKTVVQKEGSLGDIICFGMNLFENYCTMNTLSEQNHFIGLGEINFPDTLSRDSVVDFFHDIEKFETGSRKDSTTSEVSAKLVPSLCDHLLMNRKIHEKLSQSLNVNISYLKSTSRRRSSGSLFLIPSNTLRSRSSSMCSSLLTAESSSVILARTPRRSSMPPSLCGSTGNCSTRCSGSNNSLIFSTGNIHSKFSSKCTSRTSSPLRVCESERESPTTSFSAPKRPVHKMAASINRCQSIPTIICSSIPNDATNHDAKIAASTVELNTNFAANPIAESENILTCEARRPVTIVELPSNNETIKVITDEISEYFQANLNSIQLEKWRAFRTGNTGRVIGGILTVEGRSDSKLNIDGSIVDAEEIEEGLMNVK